MRGSDGFCHCRPCSHVLNKRFATLTHVLHCFLPHLGDQIEPIPGDANDLALKALFAAFPSAARQQLTLVELRTASGQNITGRADARVAVDRLSLFAEPYIASGFLSRDSGARAKPSAASPPALSPAASALRT